MTGFNYIGKVFIYVARDSVSHVILFLIENSYIVPLK